MVAARGTALALFDSERVKENIAEDHAHRRRKSMSKQFSVPRVLVGVLLAGLLLVGLSPATATVRAAAPPRITLHVNGSAQPISVLARHQFLVDAMGFQGGESIKVQVSYPTFGGNTVLQTRTVTAGSDGSATGISLYAPGRAKIGWADVAATGQSSGKQAHGRIWIAYRPYVYLRDQSIAPNSWAVVEGRAFVTGASVRVQITIQESNGSQQTLTVNASADNSGNFTKWVRIPGYTSAGNYTVTVFDTVGGFKRYAKLSVSQQPAPKPTATPTAHASALVSPSATLPNQDVVVSGSGFPSNTNVSISATLDLRGGGTRSISTTTVTDSDGNYATSFRVPYQAAPGTYSVTASASGTQASDHVQVLPLSSHPKYLGFRWVSLWYHSVRQGTWDYVSIQSTSTTQLGIWVHVIFPNGKHWDIYTLTDHNGHWGARFAVPRQSASRHSNQAYIAFQLWHGKQTMQSFLNFVLV